MSQYWNCLGRGEGCEGSLTCVAMFSVNCQICRVVWEKIPCNNYLWLNAFLNCGVTETKDVFSFLKKLLLRSLMFPQTLFCGVLTWVIPPKEEAPETELESE